MAVRLLHRVLSKRPCAAKPKVLTQKEDPNDAE